MYVFINFANLQVLLQRLYTCLTVPRDVSFQFRILGDDARGQDGIFRN